MAATYPKVVGRMVYSRAEFLSWIRKNEAVLNGMGMRLNKAVYKEVYRALSERRDDLVAIVPQFDGAYDVGRYLFCALPTRRSS